jgi:adenylate cyclase
MSTTHDLKGSEARLWTLVEQRTRPGADTARIDQRIWDLFGEDWAVMFTDLAGFSRQVAEFGIIHFLQVIFEKKRLLTPIIGEHDGILIKVEADSFLILFKRPETAVRCAIEMQRAAVHLSRRRRPEEQILLCVGIGYGRILRIGDLDVFGQEVNAASKLGEDIAKRDEILVTDAVRRALDGVPGLSFSDLELTVAGSERNHRLDYAEPIPA